MQHTPKAFRVITPLLALGLSVAFAAGMSGSSSLNDPLYPWMGNGGYDAKHYTIDLRVPADHKTVRGMTVMQASATDDLSSFNLDLGSLEVDSVLVNGARASFQHDDPELTITPSETISKGSSFRVQVVYHGTPGSKARPDEFGGWTITKTGLTAFAQPTSLLQWAAVNDHPADKATFTFRLRAPSSEQAIANGIFVTRRENNDGTATSFYKISEPTTSYMPVLAFGQYKLVEGGTINGGLLGQVRIRNYLAPGTASYYDSSFAKAGEMIRFFGEKLGAYPFREYGIITHDIEAGFALENQTLSSFPAKFQGFDKMPAEDASAQTEEVYAHELAHQWFGALVSYQDHSQIFIHEGFAEFLGRLWSQHSKYRTLEEATKDDYGFMLYAKEGGYFQFDKAGFLGLLKKSLNIKPEFVFDATKVGQALDLMFSGTLPAASRASILEKAATGPNSGLNIEQLTNEIGQLPFTKVAVTRRINREVRRLADPSLEPVQPSPVPGTIKPGDDPFDGNVYARGAATLHALYLKVGEETFFKILRTYLERHRFANATNEDFLKVVTELGGADARALSERWLFDDRLPDFPELGIKAEDYKLGADFK